MPSGHLNDQLRHAVFLRALLARQERRRHFSDKGASTKMTMIPIDLIGCRIEQPSLVGDNRKVALSHVLRSSRLSASITVTPEQAPVLTRLVLFAVERGANPETICVDPERT